jgi:hypothetical protein
MQEANMLGLQEMKNTPDTGAEDLKDQGMAMGAKMGGFDPVNRLCRGKGATVKACRSRAWADSTISRRCIPSEAIPICWRTPTSYRAGFAPARINTPLHGAQAEARYLNCRFRIRHAARMLMPMRFVWVPDTTVRRVTTMATVKAFVFDAYGTLFVLAEPLERLRRSAGRFAGQNNQNGAGT